jgi:DegV family protein with EDD domain
MNDFAIVTDSSCDLPAELAAEMELTVLPLSFAIGGKEYLNYLDGRELPIHDYYERLRAGEPAQTAAVNVDSFVGAIEPLLRGGKDVLVPAFSSGLSNTCNAARIACEELAKKYPERKVLCVDTLAASLGEGMLIYYAVQEKRAGKSIEEVRGWLEQNRLRQCHWFTVDDLKHLKRGGRISPAVAFIGGMLNFKPVMHMDDAGHLAAVGKARGRKASLDALVDHMEQTAVDPKEQTVFLSHGDTPEDAEYVASEVKRRLGVSRVIINDVGPVIGTHSGPGTMALFFFGTHR